MKTTRYTKSFKKSLKRIKNSGNNEKWKIELEEIVDVLANGNKLAGKYRDHSLTGHLRNYRECHILHDMVLVYLISDSDLILVDIGSHSEIFG